MQKQLVLLSLRIPKEQGGEAILYRLLRDSRWQDHPLSGTFLPFALQTH
jgi:hypothetical protein